MRKKPTKILALLALALLALALLALGTVVASPVQAALTQCATSWDNFNAPGYVSEYTSQGEVIADEETSADSSNGGAAVQPADADLASASPGAFPGPEATSFFGYYDGGTVYDPDDPSTMEDDYILFRMRVEGDPSQGAAFGSRHWNVLFDIDGDGYKEYWVDLDGPFSSGPGNDRIQILYDDANRQNIADPDVSRVEEFTAFYDPDGDASCSASSPGLSHTRVVPTTDGSGDYWIEMQIPMTAFNDDNGNQLLYPDSPIAFVFSTGASNTDPLQKDFMQDLDFLSLADPITFGDVIIPNGQPRIEFTDQSLDPVELYAVGDDVFVWLSDPNANSDPNTSECFVVTVTDPTTNDNESVTVCETGSNTGLFTNRGGVCSESITFPSPSPSPPTAWLTAIGTGSQTVTEDWTLTYVAATTSWTVTGSVSGTQTATASHGGGYTSDGSELSFTLYEDAANLTDGTVLSLCTRGSDPLATSAVAGSADDGTLYVAGGDNIYVSYTNANAVTVTDIVPIVGSCEALLVFTRATGLPSSNFTLTSDPLTSDQLYVTAYHVEANTDPAVAETIQVVLTGFDTQTLTLTETGVDTGVFRNTTGLQAQIEDGTVTAEDNLWEDIDLGTVTATYNYTCLGTPYSIDTDASLFATSGGGRVQFTNGAGTVDVDLYTAGQPTWLKVTDAGACTTAGTLDVVVTSAAGDSETLTLTETFTGSGVFMNRINDLTTTAGSAVVTSASSDFIAEGVQPGDIFSIANGPDTGVYTVALVAQNQITLTTTLTASRTNVSFSASPLMTATYDGTVVADDDLLEANHGDTLTVSYADCDDGDNDSSNDIKVDTAIYNEPTLLINEVMFYPSTDVTSCQTEAVELFNPSTSTVNATGYTITDEDGFSYTVAQLSGSDIVLNPGEMIYLSLWSAAPPNDFFDSGTYYLFTDAGASFPTNVFADASTPADSGDQVTLYDGAGVVQDYVGWSSSLSPSLDFYADDSPAVLRSIWQDNSFSNVSGLSQSSSLARSSDGFDTDSPSDWVEAASNQCLIILARAFISSFRTFHEGGRVVVEWKTSSENGTVGFYLFRFDERRGRYVRVNDKMLPGLLDLPQGGTYRLIDRRAEHGPQTYVLMEVESSASGTKPVYHGPYTVTPEATGTIERVLGSARESFGRGLATRELRRLRASKAETEDRRHRRRGRGSIRVKITVDEAGVYALGSEQLEAWFGLPTAVIEPALTRRGFRLTSGGRAVAWTPSDDGRSLVFWGQPIDSIYARENVYWLELGRGVRMKRARNRRARSDRTEASTFRHTLHVEEDLFPATIVSTDPESDFWHWSFISSGDPTYARRAFTLNIEDLSAGPGEASLAVELVGATDASGGQLQDHHVRVHVNGRFAGEARFGGIGRFRGEWVFDASYLKEGANHVELEGVLDTGAPLSVFYVDGFDLTYRRLYRASRLPFVFRADESTTLAVSGLPGPDVLLFDITNPRLPRIVQRFSVQPEEGSYRLRFQASSTDRTYVVAAANSLDAPQASFLDTPSSLRARRNAADYVVITPYELSAPAERLAALRRADGLDAEVVLLEDVMDEFNHGISNPHAIREFLKHAHQYWTKAPRFVVLAGAGHLDYKNALGLGGNLVPPLLASTANGLYASDNRFADLNEDGWPELAIGRIPVVTASELEAYVAKLALSASSNRSLYSDPILFVADDDPWQPKSFQHHSESMLAVVPKDVTVERIYVLEQGGSAARERLLAGLAAGAPLVSYAGHGGLDRLADEGLLRTSDVAALGNQGRPSILVGFSCSINRFELMGFQSLGEALTVEPTGGASVVWAPAGLSADIDARAIGSAFFASVFVERAPTVGEAVLSAFDAYRKGRGSRRVPKIYNLLGDPAVPLH